VIFRAHLNRNTRANPDAGKSGAAAVLRRGLIAVAGYSRILVYDLKADEAPGRLRRSAIALRGSDRWQDYLARRRELDDGDLTLVFSLRRLGLSERLLMIDWGTAHANTFLLIEPVDSFVDLSQAGQPPAKKLFEAAERGDADAVESILRSAYGSWVYWPAAPASEDGFRRVDLPLAGSKATVFELLQRELQRAFPPMAFHEQLLRLFQNESELFTGHTVERARSPFLTRLGLPAVYAPSLVTGAVRQLVNEGRISAFPESGTGFFQGPSEPVPDEVPNELFERMLL
jgi:hypothetical protein